MSVVVSTCVGIYEAHERLPVGCPVRRVHTHDTDKKGILSKKITKTNKAGKS